MSTEHFITDISRHIWETKYRYQDGKILIDQSIEDTWKRIAAGLAEPEPADKDLWQERFYSVLKNFRFLPAGRIHAGINTGRRVTLFNCFVMGQIEDSMDGIFDALKEGALTMQQGGGVGYDFSTLRPAGTAARMSGSFASGPVSFMNIWDTMCGTLLSTGVRRGAMMATLRCDHPDIEDFITAKQDKARLRHFNLSIQVTDEFMEAVENDTDWTLVFPEEGLADDNNAEVTERVWSGNTTPVQCRIIRKLRARDLWDKIMRATYDYAEPGVLFVDRINEMNNLHYCEQISATNPCVTSETWIHTNEGPRQVKKLCGVAFTALVNGKPYCSSAQGFFSTGSKKVYKLRTRQGYTLRLTDNHPVLRVTYKTRWSLQTEWTRVGKLKSDDEIMIQNHRDTVSWPGSYGESDGYLLGLLIGDGTFSEEQAELRVWPIQVTASGISMEDGTATVIQKVKDIVDKFPHRRDFKGWRSGGNGKYRFLKLAHLTRIAASLNIRRGNKTVTVEVETCSSDFYRGFLQGIFDADGSVQGSQAKGISIRLAQSDEKLLESVQRMLLRLGVASVLYRNRRPAGARKLPDGRGGYKEYECRADHELLISGDNLRVFSETVGFTDSKKKNRLNAALASYKRSLNRERFTAIVESIEPDGIEEVFDVQIPGINAFDANGLYIHNCGEIPLPPYGACDLGSINLTSFVCEPFTKNARIDFEALKEAVIIAVRMLDNVIDASLFPLEKQQQQAQGSRRIGLGVSGLADTLIMLDIIYGSQDSIRLSSEIMETICHTAYRASIELAQDKGVFPFFDKDKYLQGKFIQSLPEDIRDLIAKHGIRNSHLLAIAPTGTISLLANNISSGLEPVFGLHYTRRLLEADSSFTTYELIDYAVMQWKALKGKDKPLPDVFAQSGGITPEAHLNIQAALQPYIDNAISKTITVPEAFSFDAFKDVYRMAYAKGLKGCTTFRANPVTGSVLESGDEFEAGHQCCGINRETD